MAKGPHSSPGGYSKYSNTPKKGGPPSDHSGYSSEDDVEGPTLFGSILRTIMAGGAVVAIAILVRPRDATRARTVVEPSRPRETHPARRPAIPPTPPRFRAHFFVTRRDDDASEQLHSWRLFASQQRFRPGAMTADGTTLDPALTDERPRPRVAG